MQSLSIFASIAWQPMVWIILGSIGGIGVLAVLSPRAFANLATRSSLWIDSDKALRIFDKRVNVDGYFLRHSRLLGGAVIVAVLVLGILFGIYA